jgi:hypothetical protein
LIFASAADAAFADIIAISWPLTFLSDSHIAPPARLIVFIAATPLRFRIHYYADTFTHRFHAIATPLLPSFSPLFSDIFAISH